MLPVESVLRGAMAWKSVTVMFAAGLPLIRIVNRGGEDLEATDTAMPGIPVGGFADFNHGLIIE